MVNFVRTISTAVCWSRQECRVLRLQRYRDGFKVLAFWQGNVGREQSLAELSGTGLRQVGSSDQEYIVAGGDTPGWGTAELLLPPLAGAELQNALQFELRKQTPIPPEKLRWGYRLLQQENQGAEKKIRVRLFYIKEEEWTRWCNVLQGLSHVDVILPPFLALDPLFEDTDCFFAEEGGAGGYACRKLNGLRQFVRETTPPDQNISQMFPEISRFQLGELGTLPESDQKAWLPVLLCAAYGLTRNATQDEATLIPPPDSLKARRFIASKVIAALLAAFIAVTLLLGFAKQFQARAAFIRKIDSEISKVQAEISALRGTRNGNMQKDFATQLEQEMKDNVQTMPGFPEVLLEMTRLIEAPAWASARLEWNSGQISFQLQSDQRDLELPGKLEESPVLGDVRELSSSFVQNKYTCRYTMNARYDTPEEKKQFEELRAGRVNKQRNNQAEADTNEEAAPAVEEGEVP